MWKLLNQRYMEQAGAEGSSGGSGDGKTGDQSAASGASGDASGDAAASSKSEGHVWPDDWRERMVSHVADEAIRTKELKQLQRYGSPEEVHKKARSLEQRLSSGELKTALPKDASPEMLASWRKENGIPEMPTGYDLDLGQGVKFSPTDKPAVDEFLKKAHETNQTPEQVKASLKAFHGYIELQKAEQFTKDTTIRQESEEILREDWGPEFKRNVNLINNLVASNGDPEFVENFWNARLADGTPIGSSPAMLKMLLNLALVDNPAGTVVPNGGGNIQQSIDTEIASIETAMRKDRNAYNKDEKMQARYRDLLEAREKLQNRK